MTSEQFEELMNEAADIAEQASRIALSYFRHALLIELKENHTPVTVADKKTEEEIRRLLESRFPEHGIVGEEFGEVKPDAEFVWTIDPIDGTRSFIRGIPLFGTLIGALYKGEPVIGVAALPALGETYIAAKGVGAYCNGQHLHCSPVDSLKNAVVSIADFPSFGDVGRKENLAKILEGVELARSYTDCFGHTLVARGSVDAMIDPIVSPWDVVPLACLVEEAGGIYCNLEGERTALGTSFITCAAGLETALLDALKVAQPN